MGGILEMSFFVIGLLEFVDQIRSDNTHQNAKRLDKVAIGYDYSLKFSYSFYDPGYRKVLDPLKEEYLFKENNTIEFQLSDDPLSSSFDDGISELYQYHTVYKKGCKDIPYESKLFKLLKDLCLQPYISKSLFVFSYGLHSYNILDKKETDLTGMQKDIWSYYCEDLIDQDSCYILKNT